MTQQTGIFCHSCGTPLTKAYGVRLGHALCWSCYHRATDPGPCPECGRTVRHLKGCAPTPCRSCQTAGRTCIRCGKPTPRADLAVEGGVACKVCAKYFKPPRPCPACGQMSLALSRAKKAGFTIPVCQKCRTKGHITCPVCHKYRRPAGQDDKGRVVCKRCLELGGEPFVCPQCGKEGIRHSAARCEACYWEARLKQRATEAAGLLRSDWARNGFLGFAKELGERLGGHRASLRLQHYVLFFLKLETNFKRPQAVDVMALTRVFGPEGLRRFAVPWGYLVKAKIIPPGPADAISDAKELDRQEQILARAGDAWYVPLLERYHRYQLALHERYQRRGWTGENARFIPRTVTQNMRAAHRFLSTVRDDVHSEQGLVQGHFDGFCFEHPGYRNGIRGFVRYLNTKEKLFGRKKIEIVTLKRGIPEGIFLGQERHRTLLRQWSNADDDSLKESLICLIMLLYAQSVSKTVKIELSDLQQDRDGAYRISFGPVEIRLHDVVCKLLDRWLAARTSLALMEDDWSNPFLFPGRTYGSHLSPAAVTYYLKKLSLTAEQLFATSIFQAYLNGLRHPKVLVKAFGISRPSAEKYMLDDQVMHELRKRFRGGDAAEPEQISLGDVVPFRKPA